MYQPPIVNFPVFSVTWSESTDAKGVTTPAVLAAGGGGAGKTGVGNKISLISVKAVKGKPSYTIANELETSPETCNCVAASGNGQLVAAAVGEHVRIYASNPSGFHLLSNVQADFAEEESSISSIAFADRTLEGNGNGEASGGMLLATGGEDGMLRVWELRADRSKSRAGGSAGGGRGGDRPPSLVASLVAECGGHKKPITCVRFHPSSLVVLTASKDGTCRLWDWQREKEVALLPASSSVPPSARPQAVMCRSCCFSPSKDNALFTVQSGSRGHAHVVEWKYKLGRGEGGGGGIECSVEPSRTVNVSRHPVTSLCVRSDGARLAVGNVEGTVLVYRLPGFAKVMEHPVHDLPVTGLAFARAEAGVALEGYDLLAGSADYKITLFKSQGSATKLAFKQTAVFLWSTVSFLVRWTYWLVVTLLWCALTAIPVLGLLGLALAAFFRPDELIIVLRTIAGMEVDTGSDGVDYVPVVT
ncbi:unnamed protein product [Laminaria digitata]